MNEDLIFWTSKLRLFSRPDASNFMTITSLKHLNCQKYLCICFKIWQKNKLSYIIFFEREISWFLIFESFRANEVILYLYKFKNKYLKRHKLVAEIWMKSNISLNHNFMNVQIHHLQQRSNKIELLLIINIKLN